jgi:hypothetical protein
MLWAKIPLFVAVFFAVETLLDTFTAAQCGVGKKARISPLLVMDNSRLISYRLKRIRDHNLRRRA